MKLASLSAGLLSALFFFGGCSKSSNNGPAKTTVITPVVIPQPLPNTVDKTDTLKVMAYNVLGYGNSCQGTTASLNGYLQTIIQYVQPDLFSLEKMGFFAPTSVLPLNYADDITMNALNLAYPGQYAYGTPTNLTGANNMSVLFYNKKKLTYVKTETIEPYITDFDMYKLYYNDPNLSLTHDTTFIYIVANHTQSGSSSTTRDLQVSTYMQTLRNKFGYFPNLITMGDFNAHSSLEAGYQSIVTSTDTATVMSDPPFFPDQKVAYPGTWETATNIFAPYLTTTTRSLATAPNTCGTGGGAKSWYDHIFISPWLVKGSNYMKYISNSYQTLGNDGRRVGVDINSTTPVVNSSAPAAVINALYYFSDKFPVIIKLQVKANRNAYSLADPVEKN
ncbi:MAG: hypothetical protein ACXVAY_07370 [Mucilaginibacter sp.]